MSFKEQLVNDAVNTFLNNNEFAEEIKYTPKDNMQRTIKAIVDRKVYEPADETQSRLILGQAIIHIANHATLGIDIVCINHDVATFPERIGEDAIDWRVIEIIEKDEGMWELKVQK